MNTKSQHNEMFESRLMDRLQNTQRLSPLADITLGLRLAPNSIEMIKTFTYCYTVRLFIHF